MSPEQSAKKESAFLDIFRIGKHFRRPEPIEVSIAVFSLSLLPLTLLLLRGYPNRIPNDTLTAQYITGLIAPVVIFELILNRSLYRYLLIAVHAIQVMVILEILDGAFLIVELFALLPLIMQISLRLSVGFGAIISGSLIFILTFAGIEGGMPVIERISLSLIELFFAFLSVIAILFRERLVQASQTIALRERSL
ncbi:MAG: hypothetical protein HN368_00580, partial [Spirochaetales bacterium]|nr:hypothetical protein [Spirochaetales bacterium]